MSKLGLSRNGVRLEYDHAFWKKEFEEEKEIISKILGDLAIEIEHVGSPPLKLSLQNQ